jgi:hypothetical protein
VYVGCYVCTCPPLGRARRCVTNGIRAAPCSYAYGSVFGHMAQVACGPKMGHMAWHIGQHWTYHRALIGNAHGHLLGSIYGHMHVRVGLGWDAQHGIFVDTGLVSWIDDVGFFGGGVNVTTRPNLDGP